MLRRLFESNIIRTHRVPVLSNNVVIVAKLHTNQTNRNILNKSQLNKNAPAQLLSLINLNNRRYLASKNRNSLKSKFIFYLVTSSALCLVLFGAILFSYGFVEDETYQSFIQQNLPFIHDIHLYILGKKREDFEAEKLDDQTWLSTTDPELNSANKTVQSSDTTVPKENGDIVSTDGLNDKTLFEKNGTQILTKESTEDIKSVIETKKDLPITESTKDDILSTIKLSDNLSSADSKKDTSSKVDTNKDSCPIVFNSKDTSLSTTLGDKSTKEVKFDFNRNNEKTENTDVNETNSNDQSSAEPVIRSQVDNSVERLVLEVEMLKSEYDKLEKFVKSLELEHDENLRQEEEVSKILYDQIVFEKDEIEKKLNLFKARYHELEDVMHEKFAKYFETSIELIESKISRELAAQKSVLEKKFEIEKLQIKAEGQLDSSQQMKDFIFMVDKLESKIDQNNQTLDKLAKTKIMKTTFSRLNAYIDSQTDQTTTKPLIDCFVQLLRSSDNYDSDILLPVLNSIPNQALTDGIHTKYSLVNRFNEIKQSARQLAFLQDDKSITLWNYFLSKLHSFLSSPLKHFDDTKYRHYNDGKLTEDEQNPHEVYYLLDRADECLKNGDMYQAVCYLSHLKNKSGMLIEQWLNDALVHVNTSQAIKFADTMLDRLLLSQ